MFSIFVTDLHFWETHGRKNLPVQGLEKDKDLKAMSKQKNKKGFTMGSYKFHIIYESGMNQLSDQRL